MSDLNDLLKQLAEAKAQDPKYQQAKKLEEQVKKSVKTDLGGLFSQLAEVKAEDPKVQKARKIEKQVQEGVKADLGSLFAELALLKKQQDQMVEAHPELAEEVVEPTPKPEVPAEPVVEEVIEEAAPVMTPVGVVPVEAQVPDLDKYLKSNKPQEKVDPLTNEFKQIGDKIKYLEQWISKIQNAGPGSGEVNFRNLDDVDRSTIMDGNFLTYNADTRKFEFRTVSAVSSFNPTDIRNIYAEVKNADNVTIHKGDPVYLYGAIGNKASVIQAKNTSDQYSAKTLGLAYTDIAPGNTGFVLTKGVLVGVDTSMYAEGDTLYLGSTSGTLTNVKPHAPNHLVYIGVVERANQGQGQIYVSPQNGYELNELHDVNINDIIQLADGHYLKWSAADNQWVNSPLPSTINWTNSSPSPSTLWRTSFSANSTNATILLHEGLPGIGSIYTWAFDKTKITFPDSTQQTTAWTGTYSYNNLTDKPTLFSGSYTDLTNKPTIPSLTGYATESFVNTAITNLIGAAPAALDTLKEIADQLAADESAVSSLTTTVAGKVSLTGSYANPTWITSLAYGKLTGAPTNVSSFTNDSGYLTSVSWTQISGKPANILTLNDTNVVSNDMLVNKSITIGDVTVTLGQAITALTGLTGVTSNAATAFIAGAAAESGVALQMPREGALRNMTNGSNTMYFDVSNGGTAHGSFRFRSSSAFTELMDLSVDGPKTLTAYKGKTPFNSALDTVVIVDNLKYRISNQGGVFPQIASASGSTVDVCYDVEGIINGTTNPAYANNSGYLLAANGTWLSIYSSHGMDTRSDRLTAHITDKAAGKIYRATFMKTNNNSNVDGYNIIVERII